MEIEKHRIPQQLQQKGFGFVKLRIGSKIPFEKEWQLKPYPYSEIQAWFDQGENYGVLGGHGGCIIIDADTPEISQLVESNLPKTFTVKSPRKGAHFYFHCLDIIKKVVLKKDEIHYGEIISFGSQVVGPYSTHPDTGTEYQVIADVEIAKVSREQVLSVLVEYIKTNMNVRDTEQEVGVINIVDVLNKKGIKTRSVGSQLVCGHPVHGSTNDNNFTVNPEMQAWHCFRDDTGGGPLSLIAVLEGVIQCSEAKPGGLRGQKFKDTVRLAREEYGFDVKLKVPDGTRNLLSADKVSVLETRIKEIPQDTTRVNLPGLLDPILKEIAELNIAQGDAILTSIIKDHFGLTSDEITSYEKVLKGYRKKPKDDNARMSLSKAELIENLHEEHDNTTIHPAQDYTKGMMVFTIKVGDTPCLITSDKSLFTLADAQREGFVIKHGTVDTARFSAKGVTAFLEGKYEVSIPAIYEKIYSYVKRFIYFPDEAYLIYIVLWVMGTYVFMIFRYYPYVWLNAEKQSGKTLLMEILSPIAFNGELIISPTESVIFRDITNNLITMFIDEVEQLRKRDKDTYGSLISLLNAGFNKAGVVKRSESTGRGGFVVKAYSAYSPKMFAGISEIDDVLQDRTVRIPLLRKKDDETKQRYKGTSEILELQRSIRDDLYVFALTHAKELAEYYYKEGLDGIKGLIHLNNRELDIWEPVFLLANVVDSLSGSMNLTGKMGALSEKSLEEKQSDSVAENETYKLLTVLKAMLSEDVVKPVVDDGDIQIFKADDVLRYFQGSEYFDWIEKTNALTKRFKKIHVFSKQQRIDDEKMLTYRVSLTDLKDLCDRYLKENVR